MITHPDVTSPANRAQAVGRLGAVAHAVAGRLGAIAARSRGGMSDIRRMSLFPGMSGTAALGRAKTALKLFLALQRYSAGKFFEFF